MPDPTKYEPGYSYTGFESHSPKSPKPGPQLDNDFAKISNSVNETIDALEDIRRSDGQLQNGIVGKDQLNFEIVDYFDDVIQAAADAEKYATETRNAALLVRQTVTTVEGQSIYTHDDEGRKLYLFRDGFVVNSERDLTPGVDYRATDDGALEVLAPFDAGTLLSLTSIPRVTNEDASKSTIEAMVKAGEEADRAEAAAADAVNNAPFVVKDAPTFFALTDLVLGARYLSKEGFGWDVVAKDTGDFNHPNADYGLKVVAVSGWVFLDQFGAIAGEDDAYAEINSRALFRLSDWLASNGGGSVKINKHFRFGLQFANPSPSSSSRYWQVERQEYLAYTGTYKEDVVVDMRGGCLRLRDGWRYGSFDPLTGARHNPSSMPFVDTAYNCGAHYAIRLQKCRSVHIIDANTEGNIKGCILGGTWGDIGRQIAGYGVWVSNNLSTMIMGGSTKEPMLDGLYIHASTVASGGILEPIDGPVHKFPIRIDNFVSEGAGRQAFSLCGGYGGYVTNSSFRSVGKTEVGSTGEFLRSAPGSCLDIEAENFGLVRDWVFENCEFLDPHGTVLVADSGTSRNIVFNECKFRENPATADSFWPKKPGMVFNKCTISARVVNAYSVNAAYVQGTVHPDACRFIDCDFIEELNPWGVWCGISIFADTTNFSGVLFDKCRFWRGHGRKAAGLTVSIDTPLIGYFTRAHMSECEFRFSLDGLGSATAAKPAFAMFNAYTIGCKMINDNPNVTLPYPVFVEGGGGSVDALLDFEVIDPTGMFTWSLGGGVGKYAGYWSRYPVSAAPENIRKVFGSVPGLNIVTDWANNPGSETGANNVRVGATSLSSGSGALRRGDVLFLNQPSAGGVHAVRCTTTGTAGSTAVTKSFGNLEA